MSLNLEVVWQYCLNNTVDIWRAAKNRKHTHTAFVEAFNKELAKELFQSLDAQELQNLEYLSRWKQNEQ